MAKFQHQAPNHKRFPDFTIRAESAEQKAAQVLRRLRPQSSPIPSQRIVLGAVDAPSLFELGDVIGFGGFDYRVIKVEQNSIVIWRLS